MALLNGLVIPADYGEAMYVRTFFGRFDDESESIEVRFDTLRSVIDCRTIQVFSPCPGALIDDATHAVFADEEAGVFGAMVNQRATTILNFPYRLLGTIVVLRRNRHGDCSVSGDLLELLHAKGLR